VFRSRSITNSGRACSRQPTSFVNSLKKTNPSLNSKASSLDGEQFLYLTTRGRRSGLPREIEIWFTHLDGRWYVIAEHPTSHWVQNLTADPAVKVRIGGKPFDAHARILSPETDSELWGAIASLS